ncbi:hypothetical protein CRM22_007598 [Opisthorchis felineus]|uniref:TRUD domain-containing protein n=2 Tax=Opisthorchis felineus TaxID=147828 RepID=A0A4V3SDV1_OPIFE|nr:hypothetical protein CRM22_007598 [Opisthorchis felineus]
MYMAEPESKRARLSVDAVDCDGQAIEDIDLPPNISEQNTILTERDAGIEGYLRFECPGFECILKNRWEDFIVQELANGELATLTTLDPIALPASSEKDIDESNNGNNPILETYKVELEELLAGKRDCVKILAPKSKVVRTAIHKALRSLSSKLSSTTVKEEVDSPSYILVSGTSQFSGVRFPKRANHTLSKGRRYCRFVLYKEGKDTISAIRLLSSYLRLNPGYFAYAGTKDKRAITTQFVTVKDVDSKRLAALNSRLQGLRVGNFSYVPTPLFLGDLDGNRFTVVLRSISSPDSIITDAIDSWRYNGFVNYYGLQRFGHSAKSKSFEIGKHLLRGEWTHAIDLILIPTFADLPMVRQTKEEFLISGDAATCAAKIPSSVEKYLLQGIAKHGKTLNALQALPRNLRQLYVHSYQSLIWNRIASRRVNQSHIGHAQPGDLYIQNAADSLPQIDAVDEGLCLELNSNTSSSATTPVPLIVTAENYQNIPLTDVVLPLPGFAVSYPQNQCGRWYEELMKEDGICQEDLRHRVKDFALPGSYRALVVKPIDVNFRIEEYLDPNVPLVMSDLQRLAEVQNNADSSNIAEDSSLGSTAHPYRALILEFTLPKSSYATIAIRELTKSAVERR